MHPLATAATHATPLPRAPRDLTDPAQGPHAVQKVLRAAVEAMARATSCLPSVERTGVDVAPSATLALMLGSRPPAGGLVVRPQGIMEGPLRRHVLETWWVVPGRRLGLRDLGRCIGLVAPAVAPAFTISAVPAPVPRTSDGRQVDVRLRGTWVTVATGGILDAALLRGAGLPRTSGLVLTLDLDRLVLLAKGMDDPSLLDARDPAIASQMLDLEPFIPPALARGEGCSSPARRIMLAVV